MLLHLTSFNLANSLRVVGDVRFTMIVGICSMLIFRLGSAILFGEVLSLGVIGVWIAMGMDWTMRSVAFTIRYKSGKWEHMKVMYEIIDSRAFSEFYDVNSPKQVPDGDTIGRFRNILECNGIQASSRNVNEKRIVFKTRNHSRFHAYCSTLVN